ncbi:serine-arginine protein 55 isoform X2 [Cydia pomonella]|uniref:serine-arginine protein 55 isoform X2 n=1 Tax=Cydia pomonella TaxID=82600 RepID=UPI002ADD93C7|nr:serine-arginine protein 55 isoform X2 [Cydia pomonella]
MVGSRVYVGGLPFGVRDRDLEKFFKGFGRIRDILIKNGYGFVEFEDYRDADDAVYELNGKDLLGERVTVERARGMPRGSDRWRSRDQPPPRRAPPPPHPPRRDASVLHARKNQDDNYRYGPPTRTEYRLVVENLSSRISWQDLKDYMRQAGEVTYADAHKQHRNEGVVEFATHSDMRAAIEKLDNTELNGRRIRLVEDRRSSRRRTRSSSSRSRSRSRARRSRSRSRAGRSRSRSKSKGKSKSPAAKSRSRSRSKDRSRSKSRSGSPRRADRRSGSRGSDRKSEDRNGHRSKSRSPAKSKERSRSRSKEAGSPKREEREERRVSKSRSRSRSRSRSASRGRSRSRSGDRSASRSRSRSRSPRQNGDAPDDRSPRSGD